MHDGFGILLSMAMLTAPFLDTILQRYIFLHQLHEVCYPELAASVAFFGNCSDSVIHMNE